MSNSNKLQNIKAVQQMIDGTHKFQTKKTVGFSDANSKSRKSERHDVNDTWEEIDANGMVWIIEQRDGFRVKKTKNTEIFSKLRDELNSFPNCRKETCTCIKANAADEKLRIVNGMCLDCTVDMEHALRKSGEYDTYEKNRIQQNAIAWLKQAEQDVDLLKQTYTHAAEFVINSEGETESYAAKMTSDEFEEKVQKSFDEFKIKFLKRLNGEQNENN